MASLTLALDLRELELPGPGATGLRFRTPNRSDAAELGRLYFASYPPGVAGATAVEATADIEASWDGLYGELWEEASVVAEADRIVGALLTVRRAPWDDTPPGPFIIELFVDPGWRRRGVARELLRLCLLRLEEAGTGTVGLRVAADNTAALRLYGSLGFAPWPDG
ncbi:MAG: GNAT family N-acetyltransferase [Actinomycetes bacterium]